MVTIHIIIMESIEMARKSIITGFEALKARDLKNAHRSFMNIITNEKDNELVYQSLIGLSITLRELGEIQDAIENLKKAVKLRPNPKEALYNLGNLYEDAGNHALAVQSYDHAISIDPDLIDAQINRGVAWFNLDKYEQSLRDFKNALKNRPDSSRALSNTGIAYLKDNRYEMSIDYFDRSLEEDPENIHSLCGKGLALFNMDQYDESIICFDAALSINPNFYVANYYKGHILKKLDLIDEAEEAILDAIDSREGYGLAWFELGEIYRFRGDSERALIAYEKAIKYQSDPFEEALYQKGKILSKEGNYKGAIISYKRICKKNPYVPEVWMELGKALLKIKGYEDKAIAALKNAHYLEPSNKSIIYHLSRAYIKMNMKKKALDLLQKGIEIYNDPRHRLLMSKLLFENKKYKDAILMAEEVVLSDPEHPEALLVMGRSYGAIGKDEEYKQCLRKYLHNRPNDPKINAEMKSI